ncbi:CitB Response regulator containing a CheY-like receiver domain and an HTH DNA-binding domain [Candidatus Nanopelagicaceae bacterium]
MKKILIIDDHAVVREGIRSALEKRERFHIFQAASKSEAIAQITKIAPDGIIVDINLPDGNGLEIVSWVRSISSTIAIVVLTLNEQTDFLLASMKAGASSYINKSAPLSELLAALDFALSSPNSFAAKEFSLAVTRKSEQFSLSSRELQIVTQLHRGETLKILAGSLFISEATLKTHLASIYRKLEVKNRLQAIEKARSAGII